MEKKITTWQDGQRKAKQRIGKWKWHRQRLNHVLLLLPPYLLHSTTKSHVHFPFYPPSPPLLRRRFSSSAARDSSSRREESGTLMPRQFVPKVSASTPENEDVQADGEDDDEMASSGILDTIWIFKPMALKALMV
ncbi:hypothetical protein F3Y22_tig00112159pilonHSYRG00439 [Hibiscus syriacus]|uniref:Uncharacterized protein n=1 Tax=Hibiscus syriacus TaxID=106335 RepID=A0A6A2X5U2_HIBSY|nr:hypothetical protein F3Y22_tig00112159pilonHSYRG00439 [Hibiscus syriacus]